MHSCTTLPRSLDSAGRASQRWCVRCQAGKAAAKKVGFKLQTLLQKAVQPAAWDVGAVLTRQPTAP